MMRQRWPLTALVSIVFVVITPFTAATTESDELCNFSCGSCSGPLATQCTFCADSSRGYDGIPGFMNTCYCVSDSLEETYSSVCNPESLSFKAVSALTSILLSVIAVSCFIVSQANNQFLAFYSIEAVQMLGFMAFSQSPLKSSMLFNILQSSRWFSFTMLPNPLQSGFLQAYGITSTLSVEYLTIPSQNLSLPILTYMAVPANYFYNMFPAILANIFLALIFSGVYLINRYRKSNLIASYVVASKQTLIIRLFLFSAGELLLFVGFQFNKIEFNSIISSFGFLLAMASFFYHVIGFYYMGYVVNVGRLRFEEKQNAVFFDKLFKNDKVNRNFQLIQAIHKAIYVLSLSISTAASPVTQYILVSLVHIAFAILTVRFINLRKKRYQMYLLLINIIRVMIPIIFGILASLDIPSEEYSTSIIATFIVLAQLIVITVYLVAEVISKIPEITVFFKKLWRNKSINDDSEELGQGIEQEMALGNFSNNVRAVINPACGMVSSEEAFNRIVHDHLDNYSFDISSKLEEIESLSECQVGEDEVEVQNNEGQEDDEEVMYSEVKSQNISDDQYAFIRIKSKSQLELNSDDDNDLSD